ncbi:MAG: uroporphyrinogen-III C-methyltransferase, partial [Paracoccaceae bacterium]
MTDAALGRPGLWRRLRASLSTPAVASEPARPAETSPRPRVALVGAGPGAADLITLRGLARLREAAVVVHDRLVDPALLACASPRAEMIDVGKAPGRHPWPQSRIDRLIVAKALQGLAVVRLKGGDPSIFGRGAEEIAALAAAGVAVEIVPGVTAASAAAADLGRPLTDRHGARSLLLVSGHPAAGAAPVDWSALAATGARLGIYMGVAQAGAIAVALRRAGLAADTPVEIVERAGTATARASRAMLATLDRTIVERGVENPAILLIDTAPAAGSGGPAATTEAGRPARAAPRPGRHRATGRA